MEKGATSRMITLRSSDGEDLIVPEAVAVQAHAIRHMIVEDDSAQDVISLPNVSAKILTKVMEYCKRHADASIASETTNEGANIMPLFTQRPDEEWSTWEKQFVDVDWETLFDLTMAAYYLQIERLTDLACKKVADMMMEKTPEEIRRTFQIVDDYTSEEEEEIRREYYWAF